jgi:hypothetical protein
VTYSVSPPARASLNLGFWFHGLTPVATFFHPPRGFAGLGVASARGIRSASFAQSFRAEIPSGMTSALGSLPEPLRGLQQPFIVPSPELAGFSPRRGRHCPCLGRKPVDAKGTKQLRALAGGRHIQLRQAPHPAPFHPLGGFTWLTAGPHSLLLVSARIRRGSPSSQGA